jgi:hypothetical protein
VPALHRGDLIVEVERERVGALAEVGIVIL